jgi:hypothetical protein
MRSVLAALVLVAAASAVHAGVLVELTDGTELTVESHWIDGDQVHLVRGGVDMIVPRSQIKSMDENVADPAVYRDAAVAEGAGATPAPDGASSAAAATSGTQEYEKPLGEMTVEELEAVHQEESDKLLELQDKRFITLYGGQADEKTKAAVQDAFMQQNRRNAKVAIALDKAKKEAAGAAPAAPPVEQPQ